jgi:hypothetical protein
MWERLTVVVSSIVCPSARNCSTTSPDMNASAGCSQNVSSVGDLAGVYDRYMVTLVQNSDLRS